MNVNSNILHLPGVGRSKNKTSYGACICSNISRMHASRIHAIRLHAIRLHAIRLHASCMHASRLHTSRMHTVEYSVS